MELPSADLIRPLSGEAFAAKLDLSWLDSGRGGALVPPASRGHGVGVFRNRPALLAEDLKALRAKYRKPLNSEKGIGSTIESAGRWLSEKWESLENRYGRRAALGMAIAAVTTFPLPGNIAAIIAAAEAIRGVHGYFTHGLYESHHHQKQSYEKSALSSRTKDAGSIRGQPCEQGQAASRTGCIPAEPSEGKQPAKKPGKPVKPSTDKPSVEATASKVKLKASKQRAFSGEPVPIKTKISKQESGRIGEAIVLEWLRSKGFADAGPMNTKWNNYPIDLFHDHATVEIKTGLASNGKGAQQWRLTLGEPGKKEKEEMAAMAPEELAKWNADKQKAIKQRKQKVLNELARQLGKPVHPKTITVILNPDTMTADIYEFEGWHNRIAWNSDEAKAAYKGSVTYA